MLLSKDLGKGIQTYALLTTGLETISQSDTLSQSMSSSFGLHTRSPEAPCRSNCNHNKADGFERRLELYLMENFKHAFDMER